MNQQTWLGTMVAALISGGCGGGGDGGGGGGVDGGVDGRLDGADAPIGPGDRVLPVDARADYQLGGVYPPPVGVTVVSRDRGAPPAAGLFNICYVNGFQIQPEEEAFWTSQHPELILRDSGGAPVIDPDWDEMLLDVGTPAKRAQVAAIVTTWIEGCAAAGFDALEIDNLDSFTRSRGLLDEADAVAAMRLFADAAHTRGLPAAQKNAAELVGRRADMGTDFAVAEECNTFDECDVYRGAYGEDVLVIEYVRADFDAGCAAFPALPIVLRDRALVVPGDPAYVFAGC